MPKLIVTCPGCKRTFNVESSNAMGKRATCKTCSAQFVIDGSVSKVIETLGEEIMREAHAAAAVVQTKTAPPALPTKAKKKQPVALYAAIGAVPILGLITIAALIPRGTQQAAAPAAAANPDLVEEKPKKLQPLEFKKTATLGIGESALIRYMDRFGFRFNLNTQFDDGRRSYMCEDKGFLMQTRGDPDELTGVFFATTFRVLLRDEKLTGVSEFETCMKHIVFAIRPMLAEEAQQFLADNITALMVSKDTIVDKESRGMRISLTVIGDDPDMKDRMLRFMIVPVQP